MITQNSAQSLVSIKKFIKGGPKGIMMTENGKPVDFSQWKCLTVNSLAQAPSGWNGNSFNDASWKNAVVSISCKAKWITYIARLFLIYEILLNQV